MKVLLLNCRFETTGNIITKVTNKTSIMQIYYELLC
jgi:hypothetical protein